jgi:hypothetical protein
LNPIEICFLGPMCLPSAEWAAWWQGIGTALAVFAAIGLAWHQHRLHRRDELAADRRAARMCMQFGLALRGSLNNLVQACQLQNRESIRTQRLILLDIGRWPDRIAVDRLDSAGVAAFVGLRMQGAEAVAQADEMAAVSGGFKAWEGTFEKLRDAIGQNLAELARALGEPAPPPMHVHRADS